MQRSIDISLILSFAQITFPVFLLVPPLITAFRRFVVPPLQLARFFLILMFDYTVIVFVSTLHLIIKMDWLSAGFLVVSVVLSTIALYYIMRWTIHEQIASWTASQHVSI